LIAVIPSLIASVITFLFSRKKYIEEVNGIKEENASIQRKTDQTVLETYKLSFETLKKELQDMQVRFSQYIDNSNKRMEGYKERIDKLEKDNIDKDNKIKSLETTINSLKKQKK